MSRKRRQSPFSGLSPAARSAAMQLALLGLLKAVSLIVMATALAQGITRVIAGDDRWRESLLLALAAAVARAAIAWATEAQSARLVVGEKERLRAQLARRVLARGGRDLDQRQGELAALAARGLDDLDPWFTQYLPALLAAVTIPLVVLARIVAADLVSAAVIVLTLPLVPVFMILIGSYTADRVSQAADSLARLSNHLVELARGLPVLIGLGRAEAQAESLTEISEGYRRRTMTTLRVAFLSALALELIATISVALVAVFIGVRLVHGTLSLEIGLLVLILAPECYQPFREIGAAHHAAEDGREAMSRIRAIIDRPLSRLVPASSRPVGAVEIRDLTVRYPDRAAPAIDHLSFTVPVGAIAALTGASGSGKTTVLAAISGLLGDTQSTGDDSGIEVSGEIVGVDRDRLAWVSQHPVPMAETVLDDVALAAHRDPTVEVMPILARLGIANLAHRHPAELSPGELRRVAIARALARVESGATLLLLDEPTAHLDRASAAIFIDAIASLRGKVTIILATHDPAARQLADLDIAVGAGQQIQQPAIDFDMPGADAPAIALSKETRSSSPEPLSLRDTWQLLHHLLEIPRSRIAATLALGSLAALSGVALTALSGWLIVRASEQPPILTLAVAIVGVRFFGVGRAVFRYTERLVMHDALLGAASRLRLRVWQGLIARGPTVQRRLRGDDVLDSLIGDVDRLRDLVPRVLFPPLVGLIAMLISTVALAIALPAMLPIMIVTGITSLVVAPALALWTDRQATRSEQRLRSQVGRRLAALVDAAAELRLFSADPQTLDELEQVDRAASAEAQRAAWSRGLAGAAVVFSCLAASAWSLRVSAGAVAAGQLSGEMVAVLALTPLALIDPLLAVPAAIQQLPALRDLASRFAWLDAERPVQGETVAIGPIAAIALDDVSARWSPTAPPVFAGISAHLERGEWLTVTGPSGSGKSTLLALVMGFLRPDQGSYRINGRDTAGLAGESIRQSIAWCPQDAHLFDSSLRANLLLARPRDAAPSQAAMESVLEQVGLGPLLADMPLGLDTRLGPQGANLSGGQRQRVAVARALLTGADLLLIDEPTAHLDQENARRLMEDLRRSLRDRAIIVVTHRPDDLAPSDKRLVLSAIPQPTATYG